jgi:hypothetical protein
LAIRTCKNIGDIPSNEASGWFPNVESHGFSLFEEMSRQVTHVGTSASRHRADFKSWRSPCRRVGWSRMALLLGRRSNTITRCHSSRRFFYRSLIIFTDVPFMLLKFYTMVGTTLTYDYPKFGIYWVKVEYCHHT